MTRFAALSTILLLAFTLHASQTQKPQIFNPSPTQPKRIVSMAPVITEIIFALGEGRKLVGVTSYCDRPLLALKIAKIGGFIDPQLESILALKPDLVISMPQAPVGSVLNHIKTKGISLLVGFGDTTSEIRDLIFAVGAALGKKNAALKLVEQFDNQQKLTKNYLGKLTKKPKVLLVISTSPLVVAGPATFAHDMLLHIGGESPMEVGAPKWPVWTIETLAKYAPDVIIATQGQDALPSLKAALAPIMSLPTLKNTKILATKEMIFHRPGIYLPNDTLRLARLLFER